MGKYSYVHAIAAWPKRFTKQPQLVCVPRTLSDFALQCQGTTGHVASVVGYGGLGDYHPVYMVTVDNVLGNGTLGLNLIDDNTIVDADTHNIHLSHAGFTGEDQFPGQVYTVSTPALAALTNLQVALVDGNQVNLTWNDNSTVEDGYSIEQWIDGDWQEIQWTDANAESATATGTFEPGTGSSGDTITVRGTQYRSIDKK